MRLWKKNLILILAVIVIAVAPLLFLKNAEFSGADGLAKELITQVDKDYKPWFSPLIELPSGEIESFMFALQAAIGAGVVCFILGRITAKPKKENIGDKNVPD